MWAVVIEAPGRAVVKDVPEPEPGPDEVVVEVAMAGLCGTDLHLFEGGLPYPYPVIPGHEVVGTVVEVGSDVSGIEVGDRVALDPNIPCGECYFCRRMRFNHCLNWQGVGITRPGGFAWRVAVPSRVIYPIGDMPFEKAVFAEPLACVLYGVERAQPRIGDRVLLFGAGPIGLLLLQALKRAGAASVVVADVRRERLESAERLGADRTVPAGQEETLREGFGYDLVVEATGVPEVAGRCPDFAMPGGKVLFFGVCPEGATVPVRPFQIYRRDITILGSFALNWSLGQALEMLSVGAVQVEPLISHRFPLERFLEALALVREDREPRLKVLIQP
ncbi:MAG TPA: alcohol dehydrogenase [Candidatus Latescibacteria bacterium]|nr:alcohol dehydrogenase [Candidatus Latescibacterota bacterium]